MSYELDTPPLRQANDVTDWSHEADVVVVGYGAAGASAAIEARRLQANGLQASVEVGLLTDSGSALRARGLTVREEEPSAAFGGASAIVIHPVSKARMVGSDFRREAWGIAW